MTVLEKQDVPRQQFTDDFEPLGMDISTGDTTFKFLIEFDDEFSFSDFQNANTFPADSFRNYFIPQGAPIFLVGAKSKSKELYEDVRSSDFFSTFDWWDIAFEGDLVIFDLNVSRTINGAIGSPPSFLSLVGDNVIERAESLTVEAIDALPSVGDTVRETVSTLKLAKNIALGVGALALFAWLGGGRLFADAAKGFAKKGKK